MDYLRDLHAVRGTGRATDEQSYKSKLEILLTAVGKTFKPELFATMELKQEGAGQPDLGVFEKRSRNLRLVVEVKPTQESIHGTASGAQVSKYWKRYGFVLATNFREFVLVARNAETGKAQIEARYQLASTHDAFWRSKPEALAKEHEQGLADFLHGVFARPAPILKPEDLAADLARHAREAKRRLGRKSADALRPLQEAFESALGLTFEDEKGLDFFRSSLVQTLFYGLFSGWMLWRQTLPVGEKPPRFDWKDASDFLALPLIGDLFDEVAKPKRLTELDLREPLEWAAASLNRVSHSEFFASFDADHAITLFYEPFLQAFDPVVRKQLGVWYTPPEIVHYMVERVDHLLRSELGIEDGLADENVYVLDPATGTGSYLVEVAKCIHRTLVDNGAGGLAAAGVKKAMATRIFGFEILPAPYVVAHLQLGVLLKAIGAGLASSERAGVYLTNALTGWAPPKGAKKTLAFPFLQDEQDRAATVKRERPIIVILGNPPYNRFAGVAEDEEADLIEPYKAGLYEKWKVRKQLLDELYIRFFRLGEKRIGETAKRGIVCYISNSSWLEGTSHPVMRERILSAFDSVFIDNCNGDKYKTGKRTPDGRSDESMFTTDEHRVGIQVGTAIATLVVRGTEASGPASVHYRDLWGTGNDKRAALLASLTSNGDVSNAYATVTPTRSFRWVIAGKGSGAGSAGYEEWAPLDRLFPIHYSGLNENRQGALFAEDRIELEAQMRLYFDGHVDDASVSEKYPLLMTKAAGYAPGDVRARAVRKEIRFEPGRVRRVVARPFDETWVYWEDRVKLLNRARQDFVAQCWDGNLFISASQTGRKGGFNQPFVVDKLGDLHLQDPWSQFFPMTVVESGTLENHAPQPNIDHKVLAAVCNANGIAVYTADGHTLTKAASEVAESIFFHACSIFWSSDYRAENSAALRQNWPRVPLPSQLEQLKASAALGVELVALLLPDRPVPGVTTGKLRAELKELAVPARADGRPIDPDQDLEVTARWGFRGKGNTVMPGSGKVTPNAGGEDALDIWINDVVCWRNVPKSVWELTIGGYPVVKKWLSYREHRVLGRALKMDEVVYVAEMVRRLAAIVAMSSRLDANYAACKSNVIAVGSMLSPQEAGTLQVPNGP